MNAKVTVTSTKQMGNEILGTKEKTLYYLIIEQGEMKAVINVGEKTYNSVKAITEQKPKGGNK